MAVLVSSLAYADDLGFAQVEGLGVVGVVGVLGGEAAAVVGGVPVGSGRRLAGLVWPIVFRNLDSGLLGS
jgi:hypothetical protein